MNAPKQISRHDTFIVDATTQVLSFLEFLTIYQCLAKLIGQVANDPAKKRPHLTWWGVEVYVLSFTALSMLAYSLPRSIIKLLVAGFMPR